MMVKTLELDLSSSGSSFSDVPGDYWAKKYIETAKAYLTGYQSGDKILFKPKAQAVREDMAVALVRALKLDLTSDLKYLEQFQDDETISANLKPYVATAVKHELMSGTTTSEGKLIFDPMGTLT